MYTEKVCCSARVDRALHGCGKVNKENALSDGGPRVVGCDHVAL
jgi:hypothetical protein